MSLMLSGASPVAVTLVKWTPPEAIEIEAPVSHPPGARLAMTLTLGDATHEVRMKVHGCRKVGDATFRISGRTMDLRKTAREALDAVAPSA